MEFKKKKKSAVFHETGTLKDAIYSVVFRSDKPLTARKISSILGGVKIKSGLNILRNQNNLGRIKGNNKTGYLMLDDEEVKARQESSWKKKIDEDKEKQKARAVIFRNTKFGNDRLEELYKSDIGMRIAEQLHKNPHLSHTNEIKKALDAKSNGERVEIDRILKNTASFQSFEKAFYRWFDAFRLIKCLHFLRDNYYPNIPVSSASAFWPNACSLT